MDFNSWIVSLREILQEEGSPLTLRNGHWEVVNRKELWNALGPRIFDAHLDQFKKCAVEVLTELDPQFELLPEERFAATIHGKVLKHSSFLRTGMAETLALLGSHGEVLTNCSQHKAESIAIQSIHEIFGQTDWRLWASLDSLLPTLAEAAPDAFLNAVEDALGRTPSPFDELFSQESSGVFGANYMTGLLWALEGLSWNEEHLVRVAVILAELASNDPGGNWMNRPINSLITILLPWYPQTLAPINKRITSIKAIRADFPNVAWKVLLSLLPNQHQTSSGAHKPRWHNVVPENWEPRTSKKEYWDQITGYAEIAVEMAREDLNKLKELVGNLDNLPQPSFDAVLEYLSSTTITELPEAERLPIWSTLIDFIAKHRRYSDAGWALNDESISKIETTANLLSPASPEGLHRRLFGHDDFSLYEENNNWEEQQKKLGKRRQQATKDILEVSGLEGIMAFVNDVESPDKVGWALGKVATNEIDSDLLPKYLNAENIQYQLFTSSFVWSRYQNQGWQWVKGLDRDQWSSEQICQLLMYLPFGGETWRLAYEWLVDSENMYWQRVSVNPHQSDGDLLPAIDKLLEVSRPRAAISCLYYQFYKGLPLDKKRTVRALLNAISSKESVNIMDTFHIRELIKALQNDPTTSHDDLFKVEWAYLPLLDGHRGTEPKFLESGLATQPNFFCEIICLIFRSKNVQKQDKETNEQKTAIATNAWHLLRNWKRPPGLHEDGSFSVQDFQSWLENVKDHCRKSGHLEVAMLEVGKVLFHSPADPQGLWIVKVVANALNARDAEEMRRGFRTEVFNSRGVHWVDPTGKPEHDLAKEWHEKANAIENEGFARFAATLRALAKSYEREAERIIEDHKSEEV